MSSENEIKLVSELKINTNALDKYLFQFLKDNLRVSIGDKFETNYGNCYTTIEVYLYLLNPETNKEEQISCESIQLPYER